MKYFRYHETNCFFIEAKDSGDILAIDAGWPCSLREYQRNMKTTGLKFSNIKWAIVTHFHLDHAGLIGEFQNNGITCFIFEHQYYYIDLMEKTILKNYKDYTYIDKEKLEKLAIKDSTEYFNRLGINIEILMMPGHSEDSIAVIQNDEIIIGDLAPPNQIMEDDIKNRLCWDTIHNKGIKTVYPSHAGIFSITNTVDSGPKVH